ncbi:MULTISPECIES: signal peptidase I [Peptoniphilus]|uniref:signal peptidase I n=1 Tax=Peptoniphilus TaxID=162289 RepID=UPI0001DA9C1D|nr:MULTISPECIES: signal peptidase I [Peptoniphilus]EFI42397.1 signal peptidase I [Peptoniphilus sp. oral taxon 386 str. F0131]
MSEPKKESFLSFILIFISAFVLAFLIRQFIFNVNIVVGESMYPTLKPNDRLITLVFPLKFKSPNREDIVILDAPDESGREYIKRIIGIPGDSVKIENGKVYINDELLSENYLDNNIETPIQNQSEWHLSENEFFVMGDNRYNSSDSRIFGAIDKTSIRGIVVLRFWPISNFGIVGGLNDK